MKKSILIVEDEAIIRRGIVHLVKKHWYESVNILEADCVKEALELLVHDSTIAYVFLDINLPDGSGFDLLNKLTKHNFKLVFITANEGYAIQAIKFGAIDYLLKPMDEDEFVTLVKDFSKHEKNALEEQLEILKNSLSGEKDRLLLRLSDNIQVIRFKDLIYCKSDGGYTYFFMCDGRQFLASKGLKEYEDILPKKQFVRTHQSYLVNLNYVDRYDKEGMLVLISGTSIPVSVRKKDYLLKHLI